MVQPLSGAQARQQYRQKIFQPAQVRIAQQDHKAFLLDLSPGGTKLHCDTPPSVGAKVTILCAGLSLRGEVRWRNGRKVGVCFQPQISEQQAMHIALNRDNAPKLPLSRVSADA